MSTYVVIVDQYIEEFKTVIKYSDLSFTVKQNLLQKNKKQKKPMKI